MINKLRAQRGEAGFTLVELLIVVAILGVLAGVVVFSVAGVQDDSQKAACKTEAATVRAAQEAHFVKKNKQYAASGADLVTEKFLASAPTLVTTTSTTPFSTYTVAWAGTTCSAISGIGTP